MILLEIDFVRDALIHELDEAFHYGGKRIFDPHANDIPQKLLSEFSLNELVKLTK